MLLFSLPILLVAIWTDGTDAYFLTIAFILIAILFAIWENK
jgi:hypothetical protein